MYSRAKDEFIPRPGRSTLETAGNFPALFYSNWLKSALHIYICLGLYANCPIKVIISQKYKTQQFVEGCLCALAVVGYCQREAWPWPAPKLRFANCEGRVGGSEAKKGLAVGSWKP